MLNKSDPVQKRDDGNGGSTADATGEFRAWPKSPILSSHDLLDNLRPSSVYEKMVQSFLSPLHASVPGRVRVSLEKYLRSLALQVCLASHLAVSVRMPADHRGASPGLGTESNEEIRLQLPMRKRDPASPLVDGKSSDTPSASSEASTSSLSRQRHSETRTASVSNKESGLSASSRTPVSSQLSAPAMRQPDDSPIEHMGRLTKLPAQPELPRELTSILDHWALGANPDDYDWATTTQALMTDTEADDTATDSAQSRKAKRKRRLKADVEGRSTELPLRRSGEKPADAVERLGKPA